MKPATTTATVAQVQSRLGAYLKASESGPVVVTRNGKAVAVLLGVHDEADVERLLAAQAPRLQALLDRSRGEIRAGRGISHDEFWAQLERAKARKPRRDVKPPSRRNGVGSAGADAARGRKGNGRP